jgi:hypothetical protein
MVEHYINVLTVRMRGYSGGNPFVGKLEEEVSLQVNIGGQLDLDKLAKEIVGDLRGGPRRIQQTYTETSWGASGSGAELIVDVPTIVSGIASLAMLWDMISRHALRHGQARVLDAQSQADLARSMLAKSLNVSTSSIQVVGLEPIENGHRMSLTTSEGTFEMEVEGNGVTCMRRQ